MAFDNLFVRTKREIGGIELDTVLVEEHDNSVIITTNPVEDGVDITDHAIVQPKVLFVRGAVTDTPLGVAAFGQLVDSVTGLFGTSTSSNITRSTNAYNLMLGLMEARKEIDIVTGLKTYTNMLMTSLKTVQDKDTSKIVFLDMLFEEIITTSSATTSLTESDVDASIAKNITPTSDRGRQELITPTDQEQTTILSDLVSLFGG